jgi:hypothetical protein
LLQIASLKQLGDYHISVWNFGSLLSMIFIKLKYSFMQAMLEIDDHMHDVWKRRDDDKSIHSTTFSWISGLPFNAKIKE